MDFSKSPLDSTTVIVIDFNAVSPSSTSVNGKSEVAYPVNVVSSVPDCVEGVEVEGASLAPFTVTVTVIESDAPEESVAVAVSVSVTWSPPSRALVSVSALFSV